VQLLQQRLLVALSQGDLGAMARELMARELMATALHGMAAVKIEEAAHGSRPSRHLREIMTEGEVVPDKVATTISMVADIEAIQDMVVVDVALVAAVHEELVTIRELVQVLVAPAKAFPRTITPKCKLSRVFQREVGGRGAGHSHGQAMLDTRIF
jgi:hypothetical protein